MKSGEGMKISRRMAFCGILCALSVVTLLMSVFPYVSVGLAALAGAALVPAAMEIKTRYGWLCYAASALLAVLIVPDFSAKWLFILFFGYYPLVQFRVNLWFSKTAIWIVKLFVFNVACIGSFFFVTYVLGERRFLDMLLEYPFLMASIILLNMLFVLYDVALNQVVGFYRVRIHPFVTAFLR